jgi:prophage regulatory protein
MNKNLPKKRHRRMSREVIVPECGELNVDTPLLRKVVVRLLERIITG